MVMVPIKTKPMDTRCPNPDCNQLFPLPEVEADKRSHFRGVCPFCSIDATFRTVEALEKIQVAYNKRVEKNQIVGGPLWETDRVPQASVLIEDVRSLWNVGSIFRTADGAGFDKIFLSGITGTPPRKEIEKVSLGAENSVSWEYEINPLQVIKTLKEKGVQIIGLEVSETSNLLVDALLAKSIQKPYCLILGNEVSGLSPQVLSTCSIVCHLPMRGMKESLNVAVAFGVAAYALSDYFAN